MNRDEMIKTLEIKYPKMKFRPSEEFDGRPNGIWVSGENGDIANNGFALFNYYKEVRYVFGHKEIREILEAGGWYCEWYDAGTILIYSE